MKLEIGIVGLPNVGKSTLFKALTKQEITIANYPFATIDPNVGVVTVPDERLQKLADISHSKKIVPAVVEFYDIAGLVKGANKGEGLGNKFLSHIRETQAIVIVIRIFGNSEIIHVEGNVNPLRDLEIINAELILKDLETIEKRLKSLEGEKRTGDKKAAKNFEILDKIREELATGNLAVKYASEEIVKELQLLTAKKQVYLLNGEQFEAPHELLEKIKEIGADYVIADLSSASAIPELIKKSYEVLGLISFLTTGEDETRAWTIEKGSLAPQAAGAIHTDFENNFIRAEVVNWQKLVESGGWVQAKQKGLVKVEGKEYVVQDGDVMVIRHG
ncbi:MAG TPA: redox-regulated ATPase YchF [Candidatus Paceibacterota bacterium]|nr:redox-regulated ATPase YchF [Candidatus Paceibacterota bacterium]